MDAKLPTPPFKCSTCGKVHNEVPDVGYSEPYYTFELTLEDRAKRAQIGSDLCMLDKEHFFIRGVMLFPIKGQSVTFGWGVWSSLSKTNFERYVEHYNDDLSGWEPMFGWLSNKLPGYRSTLSLPLSVQTQCKGTRPLFKLENEDHPLVHDQRNGMSVEKWWEIVGPVLHGPGDE